MFAKFKKFITRSAGSLIVVSLLMGLLPATVFAVAPIPQHLVVLGDEVVEGTNVEIAIYGMSQGNGFPNFPLPVFGDLPNEWDVLIKEVSTGNIIANYKDGDLDKVPNLSGYYTFVAPAHQIKNYYDVQMVDAANQLISEDRFEVLEDLSFDVDRLALSAATYIPGDEVRVTVSQTSQIGGQFGFAMNLPSNLPEGWMLKLWRLEADGVLVGTSDDGTISKDQFNNGVYTFDAPDTLDDYAVNLYDENNVKITDVEFKVVAQAFFVFNPTMIGVEADTVEPGADVVVKTGWPIEGADDVYFSIPASWDIEVWRAAGLAGPEAIVASLDGGEITALGNGAYSFVAEDLAVGYDVRMVNANGETVDNDQFQVKAGVFIPHFDIDLPDIFFPEQDVEDPAPAPLRCSDVAADFWAYDMINTLLSENVYPVILNGNEMDCRPFTPVLRKEFTLWLLNAYQAEAIVDIDEFNQNYDYSNSPFSDVDGDSPYDPYIVMAAQLGIINGHPDGTFKPNAPINRAEVLKILLRSSNLFNNSDAEVASLDPAHRPNSKFVDTDDTEAWYYSYLHYATQANVNIIEGRQYAQGGAMIRKADMGEGVLYAEAAKILYLARQFEANLE